VNETAGNPPQLPFDLTGVIPTSRVVYVNTDETLVVVNRDRLELYLQESLDRMGKRDRWMVPLGVLVPLGLTVATTSFTKRFGIGGAEWETTFVLLSLFTIGWLICMLKKRGRSITARSMIEDLTNSTPVRMQVFPVAEVVKSADASPCHPPRPSISETGHAVNPGTIRRVSRPNHRQRMTGRWFSMQRRGGPLGRKGERLPIAPATKPLGTKVIDGRHQTENHLQSCAKLAA
jgi:hypothetical protein